MGIHALGGKYSRKKKVLFEKESEIPLMGHIYEMALIQTNSNLTYCVLDMSDVQLSPVEMMYLQQALQHESTLLNYPPAQFLFKH